MRQKLFLYGSLTTALSLLFFYFLLLILPYPELDAFLQKPYSLPVLDRRGEVLQILALSDGSRREFCPLDEIPQEVIDVFIGSEDKRYYTHFGIDPVALIRALYQNIDNQRIVSGASTITMQLSRIIAPHDHTIGDKIQEMFHAIRLEMSFSKEKILELWLNSIPFGYNAVGIATASKVFFGKPLQLLSLKEILLLAVIPRSPGHYHPLLNTQNAVTAALELAGRLGYDFTEEDFIQSIQEINTGSFSWPFYAPHFVELIKGQITKEEWVRGRPLKTTLDLKLQSVLQGSLNFYLYYAEENRISTGAGIIIDNETGEILAYLGSHDFFDEEASGQIDGVQIKNQPGSALKPFLYALALEMGFTPATILPDIPLQFGQEEVYIPTNFNRRFNGPVRLRTALASSLNVPAVYLIERIGVFNFMDKLIQLDFNSLLGMEETVGSGLALGNAEVSLFELARAFTVFPRAGIKVNLKWRLEGQDLIEEERIFDTTTAGLIRDILADKVSRITGFGLNNPLDTPYTAMFKTGTSNQFNDIWALGATVDYTVGVWMGNFSGDTVIGKTGSSLPASVVKECLAYLTTEPVDFPPIPGVVHVPICSLSGELAGPYCPGIVYEYFKKEDLPGLCTYHKLENGKVTIQYPPKYTLWVEKYGFSGDTSSTDGFSLPQVIKPQNNAVFYFDPTIPIKDQAVKIEIISENIEDPISLFINKAFVIQDLSPLTYFLPLQRGLWEVEAVNSFGITCICFEVK